MTCFCKNCNNELIFNELKKSNIKYINKNQCLYLKKKIKEKKNVFNDVIDYKL